MPRYIHVEDWQLAMMHFTTRTPEQELIEAEEAQLNHTEEEDMESNTDSNTNPTGLLVTNPVTTKLFEQLITNDEKIAVFNSLAFTLGSVIVNTARRIKEQELRLERDDGDPNSTDTRNEQDEEARGEKTAPVGMDAPFDYRAELRKLCSTRNWLAAELETLGENRFQRASPIEDQLDWAASREPVITIDVDEDELAQWAKATGLSQAEIIAAGQESKRKRAQRQQNVLREYKSDLLAMIKDHDDQDEDLFMELSPVTRYNALAKAMARVKAEQKRLAGASINVSNPLLKGRFIGQATLLKEALPKLQQAQDDVVDKHLQELDDAVRRGAFLQ